MYLYLTQNTYPFYGGPLDGEWKAVTPVGALRTITPFFGLKWTDDGPDGDFAQQRTRVLEATYWKHRVVAVTGWGRWEAHIYVYSLFRPTLFQERWEFEVFGLVERTGRLRLIEGWRPPIHFGEQLYGPTKTI